jgi:pimeloyl-ACP methyl ester carboxylesterase
MRHLRFLVPLVVFLLASLPARAEDGTFDSNGVKIAYQVVGKGEPVVLIHGFSVNAQIQWGIPGIIKDLSTNYRVIALDNRGHGKSGKPHDPEQYGPEMVKDLIRLLDHLQIKKAHFVGYSMGAFISCHLAATHPDRILSVTLGGGGWPRQEMSGFMEELADSIEKNNSVEPLLVRLTPPGNPKPTPEQIKQVNSLILSINDPKALAAVLRGSKKLVLTEEQVRQIRVPLLALIGDQDPLKNTIDALKPFQPQLRVVEIKDADHMNAFAKPAFLTALREFLIQHKEKASQP